MAGEEMLIRGNVTAISAADLKPEETGPFLDQVVAVEQSAWPPELQAPRAKFQSRMEVFPQGFIGLKVNGDIKAVTTSQVCQYDPSDESSHTWDEFTDGGMIAKSHDPSGNALYVVSVGVAKDAQGMGLGGKLVDEQKKVAKKLGLKYLFLGARIPGYTDYVAKHGEISVEEYLKRKNEEGESVDPEIRFYQRQGLKPARVIPNFEPDDASHGYGVVMIWDVE